jgi:RNase adaptor protein for sRNA GlmZ degradation
VVDTMHLKKKNLAHSLLKKQSHEKVCEILIWDVSFGLNYGSPTFFKIFK